MGQLQALSSPGSKETFIASLSSGQEPHIIVLSLNSKKPISQYLKMDEPGILLFSESSNFVLFKSEGALQIFKPISLLEKLLEFVNQSESEHLVKNFKAAVGLIIEHECL